MQIVNCTVGRWRARATVHEVDNGKLLASISAVDESGNQSESTHTIVFDHQEGKTRVEETAALVQSLLLSRYGG